MSAHTESIGEMARLYLGLRRKNGAEIGKEAVLDWMGRKLQSFTVVEGQGVFRCTPEPVLILHVAGQSKETILRMADELRQHFEQDGVGVEWQGRYERVTQSPAERMGQDRKILTLFNQELARGKTVAEMSPEIQAWWGRRY